VLQLLRVTGESLSPFFVQGDYVLVTKLPFALERLKAGDIVVFRHPAYGVMIKRLERLSEDGQELYVLGAHPESTDSRSFGPVPRRWVTGKVIWRIASPPPKGKPT
jgi:nickel-type superoxide dismutase maturation protease